MRRPVAAAVSGLIIGVTILRSLLWDPPSPPVACTWKRDRCLPNSSIAGLKAMCTSRAIPSAWCEALGPDGQPCAMAMEGHHVGCNPYFDVGDARARAVAQEAELARQRGSSAVTDPARPVPPRRLSATDVMAILRRRAYPLGVLMAGDSVMRQLFVRLVAYARGAALVAEHYFHSDALFIVDRNGTDVLLVLDRPSAFAASRLVLGRYFPRHRYAYARAFGGTAYAYPDRNVALAVLYQWDPVPSRYRKPFRTMLHGLHVAGFMYHWPPTGPLSDIDPYLKAVRIKQRGSNVTYVYVTPPPVPTFPHSLIHRRERHVRKWLRGVPGVKWLNYAGLFHDGPEPKVDAFHFQCEWLPRYPEPVVQMKHNGTGCRDRTNLAVLWRLGHLLNDP